MDALDALDDESWSDGDGDDDGGSGGGGAATSASSGGGGGGAAASTALQRAAPVAVQCPPPASDVLVHFGGQLDRLRQRQANVAAAAQSFIRRGSNITLAMPDKRGSITARVVHGENDAACKEFLAARLAQCASDLRGRPAASNPGEAAAANAVELLDCYTILGVAPDADAKTIKATWRALLPTVHPDKGGAKDVFIRLQKAYKQISDPLRRKEFDRERGRASEPRALAAKSYYAVDLYADDDAQAQASDHTLKMQRLSNAVDAAATTGQLENAQGEIMRAKQAYDAYIKEYERERLSAIERLAALPGVFRSDDIMRTVSHCDVVIPTDRPGGSVLEPMRFRSVTGLRNKVGARGALPLHIACELPSGETKELEWFPHGDDGYPIFEKGVSVRLIASAYETKRSRGKTGQRLDLVPCLRPGEIGEVLHVDTKQGAPRSGNVWPQHLITVRGPRRTEQQFYRNDLARVPGLGDRIKLASGCEVDSELSNGEGTTKCLLQGEYGTVEEIDLERRKHPFKVRGPRGDASVYAVDEVEIMPRCGMRVSIPIGEVIDHHHGTQRTQYGIGQIYGVFQKVTVDGPSDDGEEEKSFVNVIEGGGADDPASSASSAIVSANPREAQQASRGVQVPIFFVPSEIVCSETKRLVCSVLGVLATDVTSMVNGPDGFRAMSDELRSTAGSKSKGTKARAGRRCKRCGNQEERYFRQDFVKGNTVCTKCGSQFESRTLYDGQWARTFEDSKVNREQYGLAPDQLLSEGSNFQTRMERTTEDLSDFQKGIADAMRRTDAGQDSLGQERGSIRTRNSTKDEDIKWARRQAELVQLKLQLKNWARKETWALKMFARYRRIKEHLVKKKEVFACCMVVAHNMVEREVGAMGSTLAEQGARVVGSEIVLFAQNGEVCCQDRWEKEFVPPVRRERSTPSELQHKGWSRVQRARKGGGGQRESVGWIHGTAGTTSGWEPLQPSESSRIDQIVKLKSEREDVKLGGLKYTVQLGSGSGSGSSPDVTLSLPELLGGDVWDQHKLLLEVVEVHGVRGCFPVALKDQLKSRGKPPVSKGFGLKVTACRVGVAGGDGGSEGGGGASSSSSSASASSLVEELDHGPIAVKHISGHKGKLDLTSAVELNVGSRLTLDRMSLPGSAVAAGASKSAKGVECGAISIRIDVFWDAIHSTGSAGGARRSSNEVTSATAIVQKRHLLGRAFIPVVAVRSEVVRFPLQRGVVDDESAAASSGGDADDAPWVSVRLWRPKLRRVRGCGETMTEKELRRHVPRCIERNAVLGAGGGGASRKRPASGELERKAKRKAAMPRRSSLYEEESGDDDDDDDEDY